MKRSVLEYRGYHVDKVSNIGDEIQSLAAARLMGDNVSYVSRDHLHQVSEETVVSMNGFFMGSENWPPSPLVKPVFYAFHISKVSEHVICSPEGLDYLKKHQPIGCRDQGTEQLLKQKGIEAYYSKCLTLTFDKRVSEPVNGDIFIVGVDREMQSVIPKAIRKKAIKVEQSAIRLPYLPTYIKRLMAQSLLDAYRDKAALVITSKIHCAMPCIAMGIPVVFLYNRKLENDYRIHLIKDFLPINYVSKKWIFRKFLNARFLSKKINWYPQAIDIEGEKQKIREGFKRALASAEIL